MAGALVSETSPREGVGVRLSPAVPRELSGRVQAWTQSSSRPGGAHSVGTTTPTGTRQDGVAPRRQGPAGNAAGARWSGEPRPAPRGAAQPGRRQMAKPPRSRRGECGFDSHRPDQDSLDALRRRGWRAGPRAERDLADAENRSLGPARGAHESPWSNGMARGCNPRGAGSIPAGDSIRAGARGTAAGPARRAGRSPERAYRLCDVSPPQERE